MLIAYEPANGEVVWTSGTNSAYPEGPPDEAAQVVTGRDDLALLRLHDEEQRDLVEATATHRVLVVDGELTVGDRIPAPEPAPPAAPVTREEYDQLAADFDWLSNYVITGEA